MEHKHRRLKHTKQKRKRNLAKDGDIIDLTNDYKNKLKNKLTKKVIISKLLSMGHPNEKALWRRKKDFLEKRLQAMKEIEKYGKCQVLIPYLQIDDTV